MDRRKTEGREDKGPEDRRNPGEREGELGLTTGEFTFLEANVPTADIDDISLELRQSGAPLARDAATLLAVAKKIEEQHRREEEREAHVREKLERQLEMQERRENLMEEFANDAVEDGLEMSSEEPVIRSTFMGTAPAAEDKAAAPSAPVTAATVLTAAAVAAPVVSALAKTLAPPAPSAPAHSKK